MGLLYIFHIRSDTSSQTSFISEIPLAGVGVIVSRNVLRFSIGLHAFHLGSLHHIQQQVDHMMGNLVGHHK